MGRIKRILMDGKNYNWSVLQYILVIIDEIKNPSAIEYPFIQTNELDLNCTVPESIFIVKRFIKNNVQWIWYIR